MYQDIKDIKYSVANRKAIGNESIEVTTTAGGLLQVPDKANYALLVFEASDSTTFTDAARLVRITLDGATPVAGAAAPASDADTVGLPVGHLHAMDISSFENIQKLRFIKLEAIDTIYVHVQYFI